MRLYRVEDECGKGPYTGDHTVSHPAWFGGPWKSDAPTIDLSGVRYKTDATGRFTHVFAMESLQEILMIFRADGQSPETVRVSVYDVDSVHTSTYYDFDWASKQILFDRTKATLVEYIPVAASHFRGHTYEVCPPALRKPL